MTGLPRGRFGLRDRGVVREGFAADLVLFDAATVRDVATFTDPQRPAEGIDAVWVNGVLSSRDQAPTGARARAVPPARHDRSRRLSHRASADQPGADPGNRS